MQKLYKNLIYFVSDSETKITATAIFLVRSLEGFNIITVTIYQRSLD
jgi:hypothetical protein